MALLALEWSKRTPDFGQYLSQSQIMSGYCQNMEMPYFGNYGTFFGFGPNIGRNLAFLSLAPDWLEERRNWDKKWLFTPHLCHAIFCLFSARFLHIGDAVRRLVARVCRRRLRSSACDENITQ